MDKSFLKTLGLDPDKDIKSLLEDVEEKQCELLERLETTSQESRKAELTEQLSRLEETISQIKDRLDAVNSAIVLDMGDMEPEATSDAPKQAAAPVGDAKVKEDDLASKVEALKHKIQTQAEEIPEQPKEEPKAKSVVATLQQDKERSSEMQHALQCYRKKEFVPAFQVFKQLAEKDNAEAQYMLANMYRRAEGTAADTERSEYWIKRSADNGDAAAQFDYAVLILSRKNAEAATVATGMDYLKRAADQGSRDAVDKFVELVDKGDGNPKDIAIACGYCEKLLQQIDDSFEAQRYTELSQSLNQRCVKDQISRHGDLIATITAAVSALLLIVAAAFLFLNYHQQNLLEYTSLKELPEWLTKILPDVWHPLPHAIDPDFWKLDTFPTVAWMIAAGWMLRGLGYTFKRKAWASTLVRTAGAVRWAAIIGHVVLCSRVEEAMQHGAAQLQVWSYYLPIDNLIAIVTMIIAGYMTGRVINWIARVVLGLSLKVDLLK